MALGAFSSVIIIIKSVKGTKRNNATGHCLNDWLREHNNVNTGTGGFLATHSLKCGCKPMFNQCTIVSRGRTQLIREIAEAEAISRLGDKCISSPSLALTDKEMFFLATAPSGS